GPLPLAAPGKLRQQPQGNQRWPPDGAVVGGVASRVPSVVQTKDRTTAVRRRTSEIIRPAESSHPLHNCPALTARRRNRLLPPRAASCRHQPITEPASHAGGGNRSCCRHGSQSSSASSIRSSRAACSGSGAP